MWRSLCSEYRLTRPLLAAFSARDHPFGCPLPVGPDLSLPVAYNRRLARLIAGQHAHFPPQQQHQPTMTPKSFKRIVLAERPVGDIIPNQTFKQLEVPFDNAMKPGEKEVLVKVHYVSLGQYRPFW
jgi:hypothetical protein